VIVSGLSGAGRTTAMKALEDLGFYCVDNLPVQLVEVFLGLCRKTTPPVERIALALDAREGPFLGAAPAIPELARALRASGAAVQLLFLDCRNDVLVARYRETRRVHPLAPAGTVEATDEISDGIGGRRGTENASCRAPGTDASTPSKNSGVK
jgi:UPF0042 nucleotide-binding protein